MSASDDGAVHVWRDWRPIERSDPRLWTATTYCAPVLLRQKLLGLSEPLARRDHERCLRRVAAQQAATLVE